MTEHETQRINELIEYWEKHAEQCSEAPAVHRPIQNRPMAERQQAKDLELVAILRRIRDLDLAFTQLQGFISQHPFLIWQLYQHDSPETHARTPEYYINFCGNLGNAHDITRYINTDGVGETISEAITDGIKRALAAIPVDLTQLDDNVREEDSYADIQNL